MKVLYLLAITLIIHSVVYSQKGNNIWCFGDSAAIDFNSGSTFSSSIVRSRGSCASIADTNGALLFYTAYDTTVLLGQSRGTKIYNKNNIIMNNGDSLKGGGWYHEQIIVPDPFSNNLYFLFYIGVTDDFGIYYAKIDLNQNGGQGAVIQKNIQLQSFKQVDCLSAVKHGNGRDWWVVFRKSQFPGGSNNEFYSYLITPGGISNVTVQNVGSLNSTGLAKLIFSPSGDKMLFTNYGDLIELYNFDRCSGVISNPRTINPQGTTNFYNTWGSEFSPSGDLLYISTSDSVSYLYQYHLNDVDPQATRDTIWSTAYPRYTGGDLKRGPDGKIYFSCAYDNQIVFNYPYPDSMYNMYNMNLSVINSPDSLGMACDFQPYSFYLGGKRTYWGLPNNPDYSMGALIGSSCDTLVSQPEIHSFSAALSVYYNWDWEKAFINARNLKGAVYKLQLYDLYGHLIFSEKGNFKPPYFTKEISLHGVASGMYLVRLETERETLVGKMIIE